MDACVGPAILGRDNTELNWRDKGIMQSMLPFIDFSDIRDLAARVANDTLDKLRPTKRIEVVDNLGRRVPLAICREYFGFPGPDQATMKRWSKTSQTHFFKNLGEDEDVRKAAEQSGREMKTYLAELISGRAKQLCERPDSGNPHLAVLDRILLTHYAPGIEFTIERVINNMAGLLIGAVETTSQAIVQALEQLLKNPEIRQQAIELANSEKLEEFQSFVWEALRFNPINPLLFRYTERDALIAAGTFRQTLIPQKTIVFACTASAMADGRELHNPDRFIAGRPQRHYLFFGYGHHECLGRYIGSVMVTETIRQLMRRPNVQLLPGDEGKIDFGGGPFPERFNVAFG
jgi:cytochrome P450